VNLFRKKPKKPDNRQTIRVADNDVFKILEKYDKWRETGKRSDKYLFWKYLHELYPETLKGNWRFDFPSATSIELTPLRD